MEKDLKVMTLGHQQNGMYNTVNLNIRDQTQRHTIQPAPSSDMIHQRWGHAYIERLMHSQNSNLIEGFNAKIKPIHFCEACAKAKLHRTARGAAQTNNETQTKYTTLSKILCDISGKIHIRGIQGVYYFIVFIDHATRYKWIHFMNDVETDTVLNQYKKLHLKIKSAREHIGTLNVMKTFKSDCATVFKDEKFRKYVMENGTSIEYATPHEHHQNGIAERAIRSIREMGMSMMIHAKVPKHLWPYAFRHAVYLLNRLPTASLEYTTTPYIKLLGKIPNEKHLKIFGCDAYALIYDGHKHGPKANKGIAQAIYSITHHHNTQQKQITLNSMKM